MFNLFIKYSGSAVGDPKHAKKKLNKILDLSKGPNQFIDEETGQPTSFRHSTVADRLCNPNADLRSLMFIDENTLEENDMKRSRGQSSSGFKLGCKVPEHNGPLGEGWEANPKFHTDRDRSRVKGTGLNYSSFKDLFSV